MGAGIGTGRGISGSVVNGWIGTGGLFGASSTGVAFGMAFAGEGDCGARSQEESAVARNNARKLFSIDRENVIAFWRQSSKDFHTGTGPVTGVGSKR